MKASLIVMAVATIFFFQNGNAQNVGVGISSPLSKLHIFNGPSGATPFSTSFAVESNAHTFINLLSPAANETGLLFGIPGSPYDGAMVYNNINTLKGLQFRTNGNQTRMVINDAGNIGINTLTPAAKLNVFQTDAGAFLSEVNYTGIAGVNDKKAANIFNSTGSDYSLISFNNNSGLLMPGWKAAIMGVDSSNNIRASGVAGFYKGNTSGVGVLGVSSQNQSQNTVLASNFGFIAGLFNGGDVGVHAFSGNSVGVLPTHYGVLAGAVGGTTNYGVYAQAAYATSGVTTNYGIYAEAFSATTNYAGYFNGSVAITDGTQGAGKVFTSDASGKGNWQAPAGGGGNPSDFLIKNDAAGTVGFRKGHKGLGLNYIIALQGVYPSQSAPFQGGQTYVGEVKLFSGNAAPFGWAICNGQTLSVAGNETLFSIIGTTYGGNGVNNFNLPDLRDRAAIGVGTNWALGENSN